MARNLETQATNWKAADATYLDGRIQDDTVLDAGDGTVINEILQGDIMQFFLKLLRDTAITPNGNPDNESNGYQLMQALEAKILGPTVDSAISSIGANVTAFSGRVARKNEFIWFSGKFEDDGLQDGETIFTLPTTVPAPTQTIYFHCGNVSGAGSVAARILSGSRVVTAFDQESSTGAVMYFNASYPVL